jgi:LemA protein
MTALIIAIIIVVLLAVGLWAAYNSLVKKRNRTQEAWSEIDVELKRRHDLIPNQDDAPALVARDLAVHVRTPRAA